MPGLPPIGAEIPCSRLAINTPVRYKGQLHSLDFRGGIKHRVDVNPNDPINSVRLRVVGHRVSADFPEGVGGSVTIEQNEIDVDAKSTLSLTQQFPPKYEHRDILSFTMIFDQPEGDPVVTVTKEPMVLIGQLTQYPPRGDLYQLEKPVELVDPEDETKVIAVIEKFPVKVGGL
ncbi:hypothetical protein [Streptomyces sp. NPDC096324]|uniref:hypothetical protein n=1 Tax=Streptomyces sp. NPDC096324 TaxID=3366085 RepID=UPI0038242BC7